MKQKNYKTALLFGAGAIAATLFVAKKRGIISGVGSAKQHDLAEWENKLFYDAADLDTVLRTEKSAGNKILKNYVIRCTGDGVLLRDKRDGSHLFIK